MKSKLLIFAGVIAFATVIITGCKTDDKKTTTCDESVFVGNYGGYYSFLILHIDDSLFATNAVAADGKLQIRSKALGVNFEATPIPGNCTKANITSIISDSLYINDSIYVKNLNATGTGTLSGNTLNVTMQFVSGTLKSRYVTPPLSGYDNYSLSGLSITGTFTK